MTKTGLISLVALSVGIGSAFATTVVFEQDSPYGDQITRLDRADMATHSATVFERADLNNDNLISANEYATMSIAAAELAHLNGFVVFETGTNAEIVDIPVEQPSALSPGARAQVNAVSRSTYYLAPGSQGGLTLAEFTTLNLSQFAQADRNRNGRLAKGELALFVNAQAGLIGADS